MINERMLELLLLGDIIDTYKCYKRGGVTNIEGQNYNNDEILNRYTTLLQEFISPYVINKDSKE